jgi:hypothetical protein
VRRKKKKKTACRERAPSARVREKEGPLCNKKNPPKPQKIKKCWVAGCDVGGGGADRARLEQKNPVRRVSRALPGPAAWRGADRLSVTTVWAGETAAYPAQRALDLARKNSATALKEGDVVCLTGAGGAKPAFGGPCCMALIGEHSRKVNTGMPLRFGGGHQHLLTAVSCRPLFHFLLLSICLLLRLFFPRR